MNSWFKYVLYKIYYVIVVVSLVIVLNYTAAWFLEFVFALLQKSGIEKYTALSIAVIITVCGAIVLFVIMIITAKMLRPKIFGGVVVKPDKEQVETKIDICKCNPNDMPIGMLSIGDNKSVSVDLVTINNIRQIRILYHGDQPLGQCYCQIGFCPICGGKIVR